jgi:hypothetical protein
MKAAKQGVDVNLTRLQDELHTSAAAARAPKTDPEVCACHDVMIHTIVVLACNGDVDCVLRVHVSTCMAKAH